jgi:hypothetical protein
MGGMISGRVTAVPSVNSIWYVLDMLLTRRRAVDYCRVATAMCPRSASARA